MPSAVATGDTVAPASPVQWAGWTIPRHLAQELAQQAELSRTGLSADEFATILCEVSAKYNANLPANVDAKPAQREAFWRSLHLRDLALAQACARGEEAAWRAFLQEFRGPMQQAAIVITRSASAGEELADSLYAELFGLSERGGVRRSLLAGYSGRGPLMGWLRTTLAQRHVDHYRRTHREDPLEGEDFAATEAPAAPEPQTLTRLSEALRATLPALPAEDRFLLAAYFLDGHTLLALAGLLRVHEATVSRRIRRLTETVHKKLLQQLEARGMSRRAAREALGTDPRDLTINLRNLLQTSLGSAFSPQEASTGEKPR